MNSKENFSVSKYGRHYFEDVKKLWKEQYEPNYVSQRAILFKWLTEKNPFIGGDSPYFLLLHREKVVGMLGHMPLEFTVNGKKKRGYLSQDALLALNYRGKGLGKILLQGIAEQVISFAGAIWFNEPNYRLYLKCGWLDVPGFYPYLKILDPTPFIKERFKGRILQNVASFLAKNFLKIREGLRSSESFRQVRVSEIEQFDEQFDEFFLTVSGQLGIIVMRDHKYLNWKFVEKPFHNYKRYAAIDEKGDLSGYIVIKKQVIENEVRGKILDVLAHPDKPKVFAALISRGMEEFKKVKVSYVEIVCTHSPFNKLLRKLGFIRARSPLRFMVCNWENQFSEQFMGDIKNWYLTYSDVDGDAWEIDSADKW